jgi:hypothetical protein
MLKRLTFITCSFKHSFKYLYKDISFLRSSLSDIYYTLLYSVLRSPLTLSSLWMCPLESTPSPYLLRSHTVRPHIGHQLQQPSWLNCWTWLGEMGNENQRHTDIKTQSWEWEDHMFLVGYVRCLPEPECLFYRSVQGNASYKIKFTYISYSFDLR